MIDPNKRQALIEWVNIMLSDEGIESLTELKDGRHFCKLVHALDQDHNVDLKSAEDRFNMIAVAVENLCHVSIEDKIDVRKIIDKGDEFEIAKICLLLLCAGVFTQDGVRKAAMTLEFSAQLEIYDMLEPLLKPHSQSVKLVVFEDNLGAVLQKRRGVQAPTIISSSPVVSALMPLQQMVSSPVMTTKIKLQQQDQRIKRLVQELNAERQARDALETEIREHEEKGDSTKDTEQQLKTAKRQLSEMQRYHESVLATQEEDIIKPLKERVTELSKEVHELRECKRYLEKCNDDQTKEAESLTEKFNRLQACHKECGLHKESLISAEQSIRELQTAVHDKDCQIKSLMEANRKLELELRDTQESFKHHQERLHQAMETSIQNESGECMFDVTEKRLQEEIISLENERREKNKWQQEAEDLQLRLDEVNTQHMKLQQQLESETKHLSESCQKLTTELSAAREMCRNKEAEKEKLENQLCEVLVANEEKVQALENQLQQQEVCYENKMSELISRLKDIEEMNHSLLSELEVVKQTNRELENVLSDKTQELSRLLSKCSNMEQELASAKQDHLTQMAELNDKLETVSSELNHTKQAKTELEMDAARELSELRDKLDNLMGVIEDKEKAKCDLDRILTEEYSKRTELQSKCIEMEHELRTVKERNQTELCQLNKKVEVLQLELHEVNKAKSNIEKLHWENEEKWHQKEEDLQLRLDEVNTQHMKLQQQLESETKHLSESCQKLTTELSAAREMCRNKEAEKEKLSEVLMENEEKVQALENQLQQQEVCYENKMSELISRLKDIEEMNHSFLSELEVVKQTNRELENVLSDKTQELSRLLSKCSNMEQELASAKQDHLTQMAELNDKLETVSSELNYTKQAKTELEMDAARELSELRDKLDNLMGVIEDKERAKCDLDRILTEECSKRTELQSKCIEMEHELSTVKERYQTELCQLNKKVEVLQLELQEVNKAKSNIEKLHLENEEKLQAKDEDFESLNNNLKQRTQSQILKLENDLALAQEKNNSLQIDVSNFQVKLEEMECVLQQSKLHHEKTVAELKDQVKTAEDKRTELEQAIVSYKTKIESFATSQQEYFEKVMLMEESLKQSKEEALLLRQHYEEEVKNEKERTEAMREENEKLLRELKSECSRHESSKALLAMHEAELGEKKSDLSVFQVDIKDLKVKLEESFQVEEVLRSQLSQAEGKSVKVENNLKRVIGEKEKQNAELEEVKKQMVELESRVNTMEQCKTNLEEELSISRQENKQLKLKIETLNSELVQKCEDVAAFAKKRDQSQELCEADFEAQLALVEEEKQQLVKENELLKDKMSNLEEQLSDSRQDLERLQSLLQESHAKMIMFEGEKQQQKCEMYAKQLGLQDSLERLRDLKENEQFKIEQFKSRINILEERMSKAGEELSTLQEDYSTALQRTDALVSELCNEKQSHEKTRNHLQEELAIARQSRQEALEQLEQLRATRDELISQVDQEVRQRKELECKLHHTECELAQLHSSLRELGDLQHELDERCRRQHSEAETKEDLYKTQIAKLEKECNQLKHQMNELKAEYDSDVSRFKELTHCLRQQCQTKTELLVKMEREQVMCKDQVHHMEQKYHKQELSHRTLVDQFQTVRVQLEHAQHQLKAKQKSDKGVQTDIAETTTMETSFSVAPRRSKRSRIGSSPLSSFDMEMKEKLTRDKCSGSSFSLASSNLSFENESVTPRHHYNTRSRMSTSGSTKDLQKSPESISDTDQYEQCKENCKLQYVIGITEDEPEQIDFSCLSKLQGRNTLSLPRAESSYSLASQAFDPKKINDKGLMSFSVSSSNIDNQKRLLRKRPSATSLQDCSTDDQGNNLRPSGSVNRLCTKHKPLSTYQKPGPPTPGVTPAKPTPKRQRVINANKYQNTKNMGLLKRKTKPHKNNEAQRNMQGAVSRSRLLKSLQTTLIG